MVLIHLYITCFHISTIFLFYFSDLLFLSVFSYGISIIIYASSCVVPYLRIFHAQCGLLFRPSSFMLIILFITGLVNTRAYLKKKFRESILHCIGNNYDL